MPAQDWVQTSAPITNWVALVSSADGAKLFAAASDFFGPGPIFASTNSGVTWTQTSAPLTNWQALASSADGQKLIAIVDFSTVIWISTNSGNSWRAQIALPPGGGGAAAASSADGSKLVVAADLFIYTSGDSGLTWTTTGFSNKFGFSSVVSSADGVKMAAFSEGDGFVFQFYSSTNSGASWIEIDGPANSNNYGNLISSADGSKLTAFVPLLGIYASTNWGQTWELSNASWEQLNFNAHGFYGDAAASADATRMVAIDGTSLLVSRDSGASWVQTSAPQTNWFAVASSADGNKLVAAVRVGGIYTWQAAPPPRLNIAPAQGGVLLSWNAPSNSTLEQNTNLVSASWAPVTSTPTLTNGQYQVILQPSSAGSSFYRLKGL